MIQQVVYMKVCQDKWDELAELNKQWDACEERLGFPPEKRYRCMFGGHDSDTCLLLREWESMAAMEATFERGMADPEMQELFAGNSATDLCVRLLAPFREVDVDRAIAERAGRIARESGTRLPDALIAATALERGLSVVTRNRKHFEPIRGIRLRSLD